MVFKRGDDGLRGPYAKVGGVHRILLVLVVGGRDFIIL